MIIATDKPRGPYYICDRCNWSADWCTCHPGGREARRPGDEVDRAWQRERQHTIDFNRVRSREDTRIRRRRKAA